MPAFGAWSSLGSRTLLLDEPFGKLDRALRDRFRQFVFEHARAAGLPTLLVTHDEADAAAAGGGAVAFPKARPSAPPNVLPLAGTRRRPA